MRVPIALSLVFCFALVAPPALSQDDGLAPIPNIPSDDLVPLPKLEPRKDGLRMSPRAMHDVCLTQDIDDPNRIHFTTAELNTAAAVLSAELTRLISSPENIAEPAGGPIQQQIDNLFGQRDTLRLCQLEEYSRALVPRAMASCRGLKNATDLLDGPAVTARKRGLIMTSEWLRMMESFLPAARACRRRLGKCLNPYNKRQMEEYQYFLTFVEDVRMISGYLTTVSYDLPPCINTYIDPMADENLVDDVVEFVEDDVIIAPVRIIYENKP